MKTAGQVISIYLNGVLSYRAAHTALRAIGYSDIEAEDILLDADKQQWGRKKPRPIAKHD